MLEHVFQAWSKVAEQIGNARRILLLSDYDGTLTPIVARPEMAHLSEANRQLLGALVQQRGIKLGVISGRTLADLKEKVGLNNIVYAGNHGLEIEGPGLNFVNPVAAELKPIIRVIHHVLTRALGTIVGAWVENKGLSLTVHYRQVERERTEQVKEIVERHTDGVQAMGKVRITSGKEVLEVRPAVAWDKGKAVKMLMKRYGRGGRKSGLLPVYLGDDITDEDAFRVIDQYGNGVSVLVGEEDRPSAARYFVSSSAEITGFLGMLLQQTRNQYGGSIHEAGPFSRHAQGRPSYGVGGPPEPGTS